MKWQFLKLLKLLKYNLRENVPLLSVDSEYNNCDQDDGKANENGNQKVHVQIQGNYSLDKFGVTTYKENYEKN